MINQHDHCMKKIIKIAVVICLIVFLIPVASREQENRQLTPDKPDAIADLKTNEGTALVSARWFVQEAEIVERSFKRPGPSTTEPLPIYPTGVSIKTHDLSPKIGDPGFDKNFKPLASTDLEKRQGTGLLSFVWYRVIITIPQQVGTILTEGSTAVFEITVDDYSEIWVNGNQMLGFGQVGNGVINGYNTRNRVMLSNHAKPGEVYTIDILGINGV